MTRLIRKLLKSTIVFALVFLCADSTPALPYADVADELPLQFELRGFISLAGFGTGVGRASFMGNSTYSINVAQVTFLSSGNVIMDGTFTLRNASKVKIWGTFHQVSSRQAGTADQANLEVDYIIIGGTGRFTGAHGTAHAQGTHNLLIGLFMLSAEGKTSLPARRRVDRKLLPMTKSPDICPTY